jgi:hypothetical protein
MDAEFSRRTHPRPDWMRGRCLAVHFGEAGWLVLTLAYS